MTTADTPDTTPAPDAAPVPSITPPDPDRVTGPASLLSPVITKLSGAFEEIAGVTMNVMAIAGGEGRDAMLVRPLVTSLRDANVAISETLTALSAFRTMMDAPPPDAGRSMSDDVTDKLNALDSLLGELDEELPTVEGIAACMVEMWDHKGDMPKIALRPLGWGLADSHAKLRATVDKANKLMGETGARS